LEPTPWVRARSGGRRRELERSVQSIIYHVQDLVRAGIDGAPRTFIAAVSTGTEQTLLAAVQQAITAATPSLLRAAIAENGRYTTGGTTVGSVSEDRAVAVRCCTRTVP
jgi:hypothetical protein